MQMLAAATGWCSSESSATYSRCVTSLAPVCTRLAPPTQVRTRPITISQHKRLLSSPSAG